MGVEMEPNNLSTSCSRQSWEGFVIENILSNGVESYYYRTAAGSEIDLG